jgi:hypothetical protein
VNLQQNDWVELLPLAEFGYNNSTTSAHGMTHFILIMVITCPVVQPRRQRVHYWSIQLPMGIG